MLVVQNKKNEKCSDSQTNGLECWLREWNSNLFLQWSDLSGHPNSPGTTLKRSDTEPHIASMRFEP